jgi:hypothetical protein
VVFTIAANLLLVRALSYFASAWIITAGELLLLVLFTLDLRRQMGPVGWVPALGRPALAGLVMGVTGWAVGLVSPLLAVPLSLVVYLLALVVLRVLTAQELAMLAPLVPAGLRGRLFGSR